MRKSLTIAALCLPFALAACGGGSDSSSDADASTKAAKQSRSADASANGNGKHRARPGKTVATHSSDYGTIVTDASGRALYLFAKESSKHSQCYGACSEAWPPLLTKGKPRAADGADASRLGTTKRTNGRKQVTYNGHPLYYYVNDRAPGEVGCQNVNEFGGLWLVVDPSGNAIQ